MPEVEWSHLNLKEGEGAALKQVIYLEDLDHTDIHVRIFWHSYSDTSWEFTREIEEEKFEF